MDLSGAYRAVRARTAWLCAPLSAEDHQIQSMPDASPAKWHLAHTSWFFETFVLAPLGEPAHDPRFGFLFNSYYDAVGARLDRGRRGTASRPALREVQAYRAAVDERMLGALARHAFDAAAEAVIEIGLHHEQQHQELLLTDLKHALGTQPFAPAYRPLPREASGPLTALDWRAFPEAITEVGAPETGFAYDNERPRHRVIVSPFRLATRALANAEVLAFIADGGYRDPRHWLADGFATVQREGWAAPLYWEPARAGVGDAWALYDLTGSRPVDPAETAAHLSFYEADAIARWLGARLPTEIEWEHAARSDAEGVADSIDGHWLDDERLHPRAARGDGSRLQQLFGDVWEWTASAYSPYPGFRPLGGALGEYNGKFMSGQMVLRGGSCFTPGGHVRASYRNFFAPSARWQMAGVRLASDSR